MLWRKYCVKQAERLLQVTLPWRSNDQIALIAVIDFIINFETKNTYVIESFIVT